MKKKYYLEGMLGLLSLLGFVGVFTEERMFLAFFAFACNFQYFFIPADEMMTAYMNKSAARAFYGDMFLTGAVTLGCILAGLPAGRALLYGILAGCGAVVVRLVLQVPGKLGRPMIRNRMKEYRARTGMKQEELAALVGVRRETIGNLENGKYNPSLVLAWNIARVFGVTIEDVFTVEE